MLRVHFTVKVLHKFRTKKDAFVITTGGGSHELSSFYLLGSWTSKHPAKLGCILLSCKRVVICQKCQRVFPSEKWVALFIYVHGPLLYY